MSPDEFYNGFKETNANRWITFAIGFKFAEGVPPLSEDQTAKLRALVEHHARACGQVLQQEIQSPNAEKTLTIDLPKAMTVDLFGPH